MITNENSSIVFEDTRVFGDDQLITLRIPTELVQKYRQLAQAQGVELGVLMLAALSQTTSEEKN